MTKEEREEWYEDMKRDDYEDKKLEVNLRTDYEFFLNHYGEDIVRLSELYYSIKKVHEHYGWDFDIKEVLV